MNRPNLRRGLLLIHVTSSMGWVGALAAFLVLALVGMTSGETEVVRAAYVANSLITTYLIVPTAGASLVSGVVQALVTPWGLIKHFWVIFKLIITALATFVLLMKWPQISDLGQLAKGPAFEVQAFAGLQVSLVVHAAAGLAVLLWAAVLGVYKPAGLTSQGWRSMRAHC